MILKPNQILVFYVDLIWSLEQIIRHHQWNEFTQMHKASLSTGQFQNTVKYMKCNANAIKMHLHKLALLRKTNKH